MEPEIDCVDIDPEETSEWLDAMQAVLAHEGLPRTHYLLDRLIDQDRDRSGGYATAGVTPYVNTIGLPAQAPFPGDTRIEARLDAYPVSYTHLDVYKRQGRTPSTSCGAGPGLPA